MSPRRPGWAVRARRRVFGLFRREAPASAAPVGWRQPDPSLLRFLHQNQRRINKIIVHHSAGRPTESVEAVRRFHTAPPPHGRGWSDIGYHVVIRLGDDGIWTMERARPVHLVGAHDGGQNADSIGVCLFGDYSEADPPDAAWDLLEFVVAHLVTVYGLTVHDVEGHRENEPASTPTACPGFDPARLRASLTRYLAA